ncbi:hypothetical protein WA026_023770 [Henosepilachna vigintioctopunctata]|uniref:SET domain-containing protein n=1 Tax=Henosepilachna vigintioctopunctata TaxID=420089 RepID=A0AAW1VBQ8_9CUCU
MDTADSDKFIVKKNDTVGRYAVVSENIKAGDLIFSEKPFAYGPKSDSPPLCLGCYNSVDCSTFCSRCGWPVCCVDCENLSCHKDNECQVFTDAKVKFQSVEDCSATCLQYECITPLRLLLAKENNPQRWEEEVAQMESHNGKRKELPIWAFNQVNVVEYLRGPCKLNKFSEELIHTACGILDINAFEARAPSGYLIRCLFPKLAILSHNCVSNIVHSIECQGTGIQEDYSVFVRAAVDIPKDGEIFSSYTYSLWPTLVRREFLRENKFFECKCERCSDATELGTHLGTLKCNKCDNGVILSTDPLDDKCAWKCTHCEFSTNATSVRKVYATIQAEIEAVEMMSDAEGIEVRETIFRKYRSVLHPKNSYMTILRVALSQLYGKADGYTIEDLPDLILERKTELCYQLLDVLNVVEPGHSRIRGITLYELHSPLLILARNQYSAGVFNKELLRKKLVEAIGILGESAEILKNEPLSTLEGQLGQVAQQAHEQLLHNLDILVETA